MGYKGNLINVIGWELRKSEQSGPSSWGRSKMVKSESHMTDQAVQSHFQGAPVLLQGLNL